MTKAIRTLKQAKFDKRALKRLVTTKLYAGKLDLRKAPSNYQRRLIAKFDAIIRGKAVVIATPKARDYADLYPVKSGGRVIVPRRKGEKISVNKSGEIVTRRRVGNRIIKSRIRRIKPGEKIERPKKPTQFCIPFHTSGGGTRWMRFPTYDLLQKFMAGYKYKNWQNYVIEETIGEELDDEQLNIKLQRQLKSARTKRR